MGLRADRTPSEILCYHNFMPLKDDLQKIIKSEILADEQTLTNYSTDASIFQIKPAAVIFPKTVEDIKSLIKFSTLNNLSITPRSAGTDMSGGAINDGLILDMTKHFNQILDISAGSATVQPGVFYRDFEIETLKKDLILPCFTASKDICTVGGMAANNSAGERTLIYGQTERYVKKLKVVLSDGNEYTLEPLTSDQLKNKTSQNDFEGRIYKQIFELIEENLDLIKKSKPQTHKNASGYYLWNVWDDRIFDLTKLIVGSQGTLGIITEIEFELVKPNPINSLLVISLNSLDNLDKIISTILRFNPQAFECYDDQTVEYALKFLPELLQHFKLNNPVEVYSEFSEERQAEIGHSLPKLTLLAQFAASNDAEVYQKASLAQKALQVFKIKTKIISDNKSAEKYWVIRHESFNMLRHHATGMKSAPFIDDIIVNPGNLAQFLPKLKSLLEEHKNYMLYTIAGHIGEGNFHIIPFVDLKKESVRKQIIDLYEKVNDLVLEFNGSLTAEHNDGLIRGPYLEKTYGEDVFQLFRKVKEIFDPKNIFNPHKKVDATFDYSFKHLIKN